jgi:dihydropteroate synthase
MGILNVTPDSFSDGGQFNEAARAIERALALVELGVDIIDVGGESTRPGATPVSVQHEIERVAPVIEGIRAVSNVVISIDTWKAGTATAAIAAGADIINDVSGLQDPDMLGTVVRSGAGVVVMHLHAPLSGIHLVPPIDGDVVNVVHEELCHTVGRLQAAGVAADRIAADPGLGFGKTLEQNYALLGSITKALPADCVRLVGASRKRMIRSVVGDAPHAVEAGTLAAHVAAIVNGAHVVRVHDACAAVAARSVLRALLAGPSTT